MADDKTLTSAIFKRHEQLKRWEESDTNKCPNHTLHKDKKVKFQDGCIFLAACSSGDHEEVKRLLDRGADINTANIDGLTALHQACIDDNLDMVEFLVENGADVDVCDNEGWTPLHATASCGFTEIARYLLAKHCSVAAVNNDGDLPFDICEDDTMEKLLLETMEAQGVDADAARSEEENRMMTDANHWLSAKNNGEILEEDKHAKTGATALHVAAAKGYVKVIGVLLQAGADINSKDVDGWTPLHAASHWGQEESCKILAENMCDMESKNTSGQTAFDVADTELVKLLEELKLKQASLKDQQKDAHIIHTKAHSSRRRSSVTRMSIEQKHNVMMKNVDEEKAVLEPVTKEEEPSKVKVTGSGSEEEVSEGSTESDAENKNEVNNKNQQNQPPDRDRDKPPVMTTVEIKEKPPSGDEDGLSDIPDIDADLDHENTDKENIKKLNDENEDLKIALKKETEKIGDGLLNPDKIFNNDKTDIQKEETEQKEKTEKKEKEGTLPEKTQKTEMIEDTLKSKENVFVKDDKKELKKDEVIEEKKKETNKDVVIEKVKPDKNVDETPLIENVPPKKDRNELKRTISAPPSVTEVPKISINSKSTLKDDKKTDNTPSWRSTHSLRKIGSSMSDDMTNKQNEEDKDKKDENKRNEKNDKPIGRRPYLSTSFSSADHNNSSLSERYGVTPGLTNPYQFGSRTSSNNTNTTYQSSYVPYYQRRQMENERKEKEREAEKNRTGTTSNVTNNRMSAPVTLGDMTGVTTATSSNSTVTTPTSSFTYNRKSFEPPKRDEETEMLRKVRAKRARETRRSTQGVTLEDVQQANEVLRKTDDTTSTTTTPTTATATTTTSTTSALDRSSRLSGLISSGTDKSQDMTDSGSTSSAAKDSLSVSSSLSKDRDSATSNLLSDRLSNDINLRRTNSSHETDSTSLSSWRRSREEKKDDDGTGGRSSSFRRSRVVDLTNSTLDSSYVPRNRDRTDRSLTDGGNITRSVSLRNDRFRKTGGDDDGGTAIELRRDREKEREKAAEADKGDKADSEKAEDKDEKRPESAAIRRRRINRERRSTGIASYTPETIKKIREAAADWLPNSDAENKDENEDENKEAKEEGKDEKTDSDDKSSRYRYGSASDVPSHASRPSSYSEYSRSTPSLEKDYKKLYEEEKAEKERLKRELEQVKKELREAKIEIDKQMKKNEASRMSDTNDKREKRALERKLSELEEEIKKMDQLKEDNRRLREENGALIRVISKLSK